MLLQNKPIKLHNEIDSVHSPTFLTDVYMYNVHVCTHVYRVFMCVCVYIYIYVDVYTYMPGCIVYTCPCHIMRRVCAYTYVCLQFSHSVF